VAPGGGRLPLSGIGLFVHREIPEGGLRGTWKDGAVVKAPDRTIIDPFRARWYRIKARDEFECTADGCEQGFNLSVVREDGEPFGLYDEAEDGELTTRCKAHGGTGHSASGQPFRAEGGIEAA
jgi:hypothetical protein